MPHALLGGDSVFPSRPRAEGSWRVRCSEGMGSSCRNRQLGPWWSETGVESLRERAISCRVSRGKDAQAIGGLMMENRKKKDMTGEARFTKFLIGVTEG